MSINRFISYFFTGAKKDRFSCIKAIAGGNDLKFCINELALKYIEEKKTNKTLAKWLRGKISERVYTEGEFETEIMNKGTMKKAIPIWRKYIKEGCAIGALRMEKRGGWGDCNLFCVTAKTIVKGENPQKETQNELRKNERRAG